MFTTGHAADQDNPAFKGARGGRTAGMVERWRTSNAPPRSGPQPQSPLPAILVGWFWVAISSLHPVALWSQVDRFCLCSWGQHSFNGAVCFHWL